jgi:hypothetical protein
MALFILYNLLLVGTFAAHYLLVGRTHLASGTVTGSTTAARMEDYWRGGFPPLEPRRFLWWLLMASTGEMAAYPTGSANGGSSLTVLLALVGSCYLWRNGQRALLVLAAGALGLGFVAAVLHKYPFGASSRVEQHLAPFYCLLAGLGDAVVIQRLSGAAPRWKGTLLVAAVLGLVGAGGVARDVLRPYRDEDALWAQRVVDDLRKRAGNDRILLAQHYAGMISPFQWQFGKLGGQAVERHNIDWAHLGDEQSVWVFSYGGPVCGEREEWEGLLGQSGCHWRCVERKPSIILQRWAADPILHCRVYHWVRDREAPQDAARR